MVAVTEGHESTGETRVKGYEEPLANGISKLTNSPENTFGFLDQALGENEKTVVSNSLAYYAELGFRVFPNHYKTGVGCSCKKEDQCEKPGKHPAIQGYQQLASSTFEDLSTDRNLFGGKFRNHDIGALTGFEWFVVDSDKGEIEGLPKTWKSKSANRGFHYYFKAPHGTSSWKHPKTCSRSRHQGSGRVCSPSLGSKQQGMDKLSPRNRISRMSSVVAKGDTES